MLNGFFFSKAVWIHDEGKKRSWKLYFPHDFEKFVKIDHFNARFKNKKLFFCDKIAAVLRGRFFTL